MSAKIHLAIVMMVPLFVFSCSNYIENTSHLAMDGGLEDDETSPGVVGLLLKSPGAPTGSFCTGTVVRDDLILTAAHCFSHSQNTEVYPYQKLNEEGRFKPLIARGIVSNTIVKHPHADRYGPRNGFPRLKSDLAFVVFEPGAFKYWAQESIGSKSVEVGDKVKLVGYGYTSYSAKEITGRRMSGSSTVGALLPSYQDAIKLASSLTSSPKSAVPLGGDSGGPLINAAGEIVGVLLGDIAYSTYYVNIVNKETRRFVDLVMNADNSLLRNNQKSLLSNFSNSEDIKTKIKNPNPPNAPGHDEL